MVNAKTKNCERLLELAWKLFRTCFKSKQMRRRSQLRRARGRLSLVLVVEEVSKNFQFSSQVSQKTKEKAAGVRSKFCPFDRAYFLYRILIDFSDARSGIHIPSVTDVRSHWMDTSVFGHNRVVFDTSPGPEKSRLKIFNVSESDDGLYRCRVDFKASQTRTTRLNLTVVGKCCRFFNFFPSPQRNRRKKWHGNRHNDHTTMLVPSQWYYFSIWAKRRKCFQCSWLGRNSLFRA
jgi:hypothetical protein